MGCRLANLFHLAPFRFVDPLRLFDDTATTACAFNAGRLSVVGGAQVRSEAGLKQFNQQVRLGPNMDICSSKKGQTKDKIGENDPYIYQNLENLKMIAHFIPHLPDFFDCS